MRVATPEDPQFWDHQVAAFDDEPDHGLRDPAVRNAWRRLLDSVLPQPPAEIADLGCGTGSLSVLMAERGYAITGIDVSPKMITAAKRKASEARVPVAFRQGDAAAPDLDPLSMDAVLVRHVTWALPDPQGAIRRWVALLRERGRLVLIEGRWSTGAGIAAAQLEAMVRPIIADIEVRALTDEVLWGSPIDDERYMLVAHT